MSGRAALAFIMAWAIGMLFWSDDHNSVSAQVWFAASFIVGGFNLRKDR
ncbi:MAG: hypothetical protein JWR85_3566 [Marmoricola sp.]|nr:hypothetical protein [Marmoricola sp.]